MYESKLSHASYSTCSAHSYWTIPSSPIKHEKMIKFRNLQLADPEYQQPGEIDILLGADVTLRLLKKRQIRSTANGPVA